ncbi:MAG: hypothetical protein ABJC89_13750, partial [Acidobacteriota bacterium]
MTIRQSLQLSMIAATCLVATSVAGAQQPAAAAKAAPPSQTIPVDPQITTGKLPNGLRYYIRPNRKPEKR